jgi:hypothetical protein
MGFDHARLHDESALELNVTSYLCGGQRVSRI